MRGKSIPKRSHELPQVRFMKNLIKKFYGDKKIKSAREIEEKTYLGNKKIVLELEDKTHVTLPLKIAQQATSIVKKDKTELVKARMKPVIEQIQVLLAEAELTVDEINYMMPFVTETVNVNIDKANEKLWGKTKGEKTLLDVDRILLPKKYAKRN